MADDYQSQRPCECNLGLISASSRDLNTELTCNCQTLLNLSYERIQAIKPT
jgi:hypothetical protein